MEISKEIDMLDKIYTIRQYDFEEEIKKCKQQLKNKLNSVTMEEVQNTIKTGIQENQKEILKKLEQLIENYEIKMAYYMEQRYKQGFKDAINLMRRCEE